MTTCVRNDLSTGETRGALCKLRSEAEEIAEHPAPNILTCKFCITTSEGKDCKYPLL